MSTVLNEWPPKQNDEKANSEKERDLTEQSVLCCDYHRERERERGRESGNVEEGVQKTYESSFSNRARNGKGRRVVIAGGLGDVRWRTRRWDRKAR